MINHNEALNSGSVIIKRANIYMDWMIADESLPALIAFLSSFVWPRETPITPDWAEVAREKLIQYRFEEVAPGLFERERKEGNPETIVFPSWPIKNEENK